MTQSDIRPTVLLTGPTSGIGARVLEALVSHPKRPRLVLLARDPNRLHAAVRTVNGRGGEAHGIPVDLSDLMSVRVALEELGSLQEQGILGPIDVAMLNAGAQFSSRRRSGPQGSELTFTINVTSQHLLLRGLEPRLAPAAHAVMMGSSTHRGKRASFNLLPDPQWQDPAELAQPDHGASDPNRSTGERLRGGIAYATSKLALVTLSHEWAARLESGGRRLNVYDPGLVPGTGLGKDLPAYRYWVWKNIMPAMRVLPGATTARITAHHAVELAMGDAFPMLNDGYLEIGRLTRADQATFDPGRRQALWDWLEAAVEAFVPERVDEAD